MLIFIEFTVLNIQIKTLLGDIDLSEEVLVVNNRILTPFIPGPEPTLINNGALDLYDIVLNNHSFIPRSVAEEDYTKKQIIPYVVVRHGDDYLMLRRTNKQTEKRLHDKLSLGIGGHINPGENSHDDIIMSGLYRELEEEVHIHRPAGLRFAGIINDESNNVSRVHLGMCFILESADGGFEVREKELMSGGWVHRDSLQQHYEHMETWSQIVIDKVILNQEVN